MKIIKYNLFLLVFAMMFTTSCEDAIKEDVITEPNVIVEPEEPTEKPTGPDADSLLWQNRADAAYSSLLKIYWSEDLKRGYKNNEGNEDFNYWWQAHLLDAFVDYQTRKGTKDMTMVDKHLEALTAHHGADLINHFYDDMAWMSLSLIRAYKQSEDTKYLDIAKALWLDIQTGWNDNQGGGIAWKKDQLDYKNTPVNGPAAIIGYYLYQIEKKDEDLAFANKILKWLDDTLVDDEGNVADGINKDGDSKLSKDWQFTYNYGTYVGACVEAYKATEDETYITKAKLSADYAMKKLTKPATGILKSEGQGDGGLFKGIFLRYLKDLSSLEVLTKEEKETYTSFIKNNATSAWTKGRSDEVPFRFSTDWTKMTESTTDLSTQVSGVFLMDFTALIVKDEAIAKKAKEQENEESEE
jgi:predicted alpha-1,6-mannanase (GH76 family)